MKIVKVTNHVLILSNEEKEILQKAQHILKEVHKNDGYEELWYDAHNWCGDALDFYDISNYLLFLTKYNDNHDLIIKKLLDTEK